MPNDIGQALQSMVSAIVTAIASLVEGVAQFIRENAQLFATILGFIVLGVLAVRFGRSAFSSIVNWLRNIL
jgi:phage-related protein